MPETKTERVLVRMSPNLLKKIRAAAESDERTLSDWIRRTLARALD